MATEGNGVPGEGGRPLMTTMGDTGEIGVDGIPRSAAAGRGDTGKATSAAADKTGAGGRHGPKTAARERVAGQRENPAGESYEVGGGGEGHNGNGVPRDPSGVRGDGGGHEA